MADMLKVKPLRTFDAGTGLKTDESDPFDIDAGTARELKALGLVEIVEAEAPAPPAPEPEPVVEEPAVADVTLEPEPEPEPEPEEPRRGRKPKAD